jgi:hypothetical protein
MSAALHLKPWTEERLARESEDPGRAARTLAGSHIADLAALKKAIILCEGCVKNGRGSERLRHQFAHPFLRRQVRRLQGNWHGPPFVHPPHKHASIGRS